MMSVQLVNEDGKVFAKLDTHSPISWKTVKKFMTATYNLNHHDDCTHMCSKQFGGEPCSLYFKFSGLSLAETPQINFNLFLLLNKLNLSEIYICDQKFDTAKMLTLCPVQLVTDHFTNFDNLIAYIQATNDAKLLVPNIFLFSMTNMLPAYTMLKVQVDSYKAWRSDEEAFAFIDSIQCPLNGIKFLLHTFLRCKCCIEVSKQEIIDILISARDKNVSEVDYVVPDLTEFDNITLAMVAAEVTVNAAKYTTESMAFVASAAADTFFEKVAATAAADID